MDQHGGRTTATNLQLARQAVQSPVPCKSLLLSTSSSSYRTPFFPRPSNGAHARTFFASRRISSTSPPPSPRLARGQTGEHHQARTGSWRWSAGFTRIRASDLARPRRPPSDPLARRGPGRKSHASRGLGVTPGVCSQASDEERAAQRAWGVISPGPRAESAFALQQ